MINAKYQEIYDINALIDSEISDLISELPKTVNDAIENIYKTRNVENFKNIGFAFGVGFGRILQVCKFLHDFYIKYQYSTVVKSN